MSVIHVSLSYNKSYNKIKNKAEKLKKGGHGMVIDAHLHLWDKQLGRVGENKVVALKDGKSDFGGEIRQMMAIYAGWKKHSGNADFQYELCQSQRMRGYTGVY